MLMSLGLATDIEILCPLASRLNGDDPRMTTVPRTSMFSNLRRVPGAKRLQVIHTSYHLVSARNRLELATPTSGTTRHPFP